MYPCILLVLCVLFLDREHFQFLAGTIWTDFSAQIAGFDLNKFTLVVWDPPGYGKSRPPERKFPPTLFELDAELAAELLKVNDYITHFVYDMLKRNCHVG